MHLLQSAKLFQLVVLLVINGKVFGEGNSAECTACDKSSCESPRNCLAGLVKDACDCCHLCGNKEGERCGHEMSRFAERGQCGDNLECQVRSDLDWDDPPEAVCVCIHHTPMCGSDGVTYDNICHLTEARYSRRDGLRAVSATPCVQPPRIVSSPLNIMNYTGSYAVLSCEARGWPVPSLTWELHQRNSTIKLPGEKTRIAVQVQNGPNAEEATSWLLFFSLSKEDEGIYVCKAENDHGFKTESATVTVIS